MNSPLAFQVGGPVPAQGYVYVPRPADRDIIRFVDSGQWVNLVGCRTMGKSSLVFRAEEHFSGNSFRVVYIDCDHKLVRVGRELTPPKLFLTRIAEQLAQQLDVRLHEVPDQSDLSEEIEKIFEHYLTAVGESKLLVILDEIDSVTRLSFADEVFSSLRYLKTLRGRNPIWNRLQFVIVGLRSLSNLADPLRGAGAPYCSTVRLRDFEIDDGSMDAIAAGLPDATRNRTLINRILHWTSGQPLLTIP